MAKILNISQNQKLQLSDQVTSRNLDRRFGLSSDFVELHIYNINNQLLKSVPDFRAYTFPPNIVDERGTSPEINMDPVQVLRTNGYTTGKYKLVFNFQRRKLVNAKSRLFSVKEISNSRREISLIASSLANNIVEGAVSSFISEIETSLFFKDFVLNFGQDINPLGINIMLNAIPSKSEILVKLLNPLPGSVSVNDTCLFAEEITSPIFIEIDLGEDVLEDDSTPLQGPNFKIDVRLNNSIPSSYKNYNDILSYSLTSSYENLLSHLENREIPDIQYDYVRPVANPSGSDIPYHFENFVHFSSATERLKNFEYKLKLIELYDHQVSEINEMTGTVASSTVVLNNKNNINDKKQKLIKGFDGYEQFLYFTSGSEYTWPKSTSDYPYKLYHTTSSNASSWLGSENMYATNYGGQLLSASLFDKQNDYALTHIVPNHILDNPANNFYPTFVNMIGHHFDGIWTYIKAITDLNDAHNLRGISKDLVYFQLKSLGLETFDQFENSNLIEYILGHGTGSSTFYDTPSNQTLITASNAGSTPKQDISKAIWKRIFHNAPYLLKNKGTERGLRALISCYGVPATILNVKEYGGPVKDQTGYKTFSYEKQGLALQGDSGTEDGYFIKSRWTTYGPTEGGSTPIEGASVNGHVGIRGNYAIGGGDYFPNRAIAGDGNTIEFRIKPFRSSEQYHLFSLSGSRNSTGVYTPSLDRHLILDPYPATSADISSSGDATQYGRLKYIDANVTVHTEYFPVYNGNFWNIFIKPSYDGSTTTTTEFGAYQANFNKNVTKITAQSSTTANFIKSWGNNQNGAEFIYFGGVERNVESSYNDVDQLRYSGSMQEIRVYITENLSDDTLTKHALEPFMYGGNSISSSYENLSLRLPLGSNNQRNSSSFHPQINIQFHPTASILSNIPTGQKWEEVVETHYHPTPDTVGAAMTSEKVRIDTGTVDENILSPIVKSEISTLDRQPQDFEDLGVFFSPSTEINEDIVYQLGAFRLDDYIGSPLPSSQTSSNYSDLKTLRDIYFKKTEDRSGQFYIDADKRVSRRFNYFDYIKHIQYIDHTLFKLIEQFVPAKANLKTGLLIEPHYLERNKFARQLPTLNTDLTMTPGSYRTFDFQIDPERQFTLDGSSVITTNNLSPITSSETGRRLEQGTNCTIDIDDYVLDETQNISQAPIVPGTGKRESSILIGNATKGRLSNKYYRLRRRDNQNTNQGTYY